MLRFELRIAPSRALLLGAPLLAIVFTLAVSSLLVAWAGAPVGQAYALLLQGGFGSRFALTETLTRATPLIFTGLAAAVAFRARLFNIGAEGQLYLATLGAGEAVGEVSLVLRRPTNAAVVALEPTVAMVLQPAHFMDVVRGNPALLASLYELAVSRDEEMHSVVAQAPDDAEHLLIV